MSIFKAMVNGIAAHYKEKNKTPQREAYEFVARDILLNDSSYLNHLVDHAETDEEIDAVHEHMNSFNDRIDIYSVPSYMKVSEKIIDKKGGW